MAPGLVVIRGDRRGRRVKVGCPGVGTVKDAGTGGEPGYGAGNFHSLWSLMRFHRLSDWLVWQEGLHHKAIDPGLERIGRVAARLGIVGGLPFPVISVAGTNGKGSCVALLESIFQAAGYRVGAYTSPYLLRYNERIRMMGREPTDEVLMSAFDEVDRARGDTTLTYFEFGTLAAMVLLGHAAPDVAILEVGMGGRLDAVNLLDADLALVATVGIDHVKWLGYDREAIGREKAGIFRSGRPAVCGDLDAPVSLVEHARAIGAPLYRQGKDFGFSRDGEGWRWTDGDCVYQGLPKPRLIGEHQLQNAATVLMALRLMRERLPVSEDALRRGLGAARLPGRFGVFQGADGVTEILDVAHNREAAQALARTLEAHPCEGRTLAVFAILADKDVEAVLRPMWRLVDAWYVSDLPVPRGGTAGEIVSVMSRIATDVWVVCAGTVREAYEVARRAAMPGDRVVVFGSFYTVSDVLALVEWSNGGAGDDGDG